MSHRHHRLKKVIKRRTWDAARAALKRQGVPRPVAWLRCGKRRERVHAAMVRELDRLLFGPRGVRDN